MNFDEALEVVERVLLSRQLEAIELFVFQQSWLGRSYEDMAHNCSYGSNYIKEIGSQLWQDLSKAVGERVTKKNLQLVLTQHQRKRADEWLVGRVEPELQANTGVEDVSRGGVPIAKREFPSGLVPLGSPLYINRPPIEDLSFAEIQRPGCVIRIKAPRKMGKTSLLIRILDQATTSGYKIVYLDFQEADETIFACLDKFLRWLCANVSRQLNLNPMLDDYWDEDMGSKVSCKIYFEAYVLEQIDSPLILAFNEVNRVFEHPTIAQDFLPMLRFWHEQARVVDIWQKLRLVVVHATEIYVPLKINQSPFNVGLSITLPPFTLKQVQELAQRYGLYWATGSQGVQRLAPLMAMVGGHPFLVNVALYHLCQAEVTLEELLQAAPTQTGIYRDYLRSLLAMLQDEPQLASALLQVMAADESVQLDAITAYKLESMGLVQLDGNQAWASCELYRLYFRQQLSEGMWIDAASEYLETETQSQEFQNLEKIDDLL